jgi:carotenoid cleavage dioxygenase-like enzyme
VNEETPWPTKSWFEVNPCYVFHGLDAYDEGTGRTELVVLDASVFSAKPLARIPLPQRVPYVFHGSWIADPA